ncbi:MAG: branched-chain amino acid ABC transporter permease, partial [Alicyclobacillus sp.]|nr:branched-chain amino acid ABC transporter permease [Alicyclobacillus sp.]
MSFLAMQLLTGVAYGMVYFMIAAGLTIILGVMNVVNLAHGSFYLIGAYTAYTVLQQHVSFWLAAVASVVVSVVLGILVERVFIRRVYGKELEQVLLTFGLAFMIADAAKWIWGSDMKSIAIPKLFDFSIPVGGLAFPAYRLFVVFVGCVLALLLWYFEAKTRIGAIVRAGVDDRDMVSALGINVRWVFTGVFAFGAALAGLSGVLG